MVLRALLSLLLIGSANTALAGDASTLAAAMVKSRLSDGFQVRMQVAVTDSNRRIHPPFKVAVIGQRKQEQQRLLVRGISPAKVRNRMFAAEMVPGRINAVASTDGSTASAIDPSGHIFDSGIVLWDLLTPWWRWSDQQAIGESEVDGQECTLIRSRHSNSKEPVAEVISCVDELNLLPWRTELYDSGQKLLRTITVTRAIRSESGALAAKAMVIELPGISSSDILVYSGDEHYLISDTTFELIKTQTEGQAP